jgi:hypothetical protein
MALRPMAFRLAGLLWLCLGILTILSVFGTLVGLSLAWFVGIRRSVAAARLGTALGLALFLPSQMILDVSGCRHEPCGAQPYLLAYGLPSLIVVVNLVAGWRVGRGSAATSDPGSDGASLGAGI